MEPSNSIFSVARGNAAEKRFSDHVRAARPGQRKASDLQGAGLLETTAVVYISVPPASGFGVS